MMSLCNFWADIRIPNRINLEIAGLLHQHHPQIQVFIYEVNYLNYCDELPFTILYVISWFLF